MMDNLLVRINSIIEFITPLLPLVNSHMVKFFTDDLWRKYLPESIQNEFDLTYEQDIFNLFFENNQPNSELGKFISKAVDMGNNEHFIDNSQLKEKIAEWGCTDFKSLHCRSFMSPKKTHEVEVMSAIVAGLSKATGASHVVDVGDGKGYLSSILSLEYKLNILGVDCSPVNTNGAIKRIQKMKKQWKGMRRQMTFNNTQSNIENEVESGDKVNCYRQCTEYISADTNIEDLLDKEFPDDIKTGFGLVGLHTCGSLSPICLRQFTKHPQLYNFFVNVGCCYHLMEEGPNQPFSFPLSNHLKKQEFFLERNARMLSLQAPARIRSNKTMPNKSLMYRAVFEQLMYDKTDYNGSPQIEVGKSNAKCDNFLEYFRKTTSKLSYKINMSDDEIQEYYSSFSNLEIKLQFYFMMRIFLAPIIEKIILYDRLIYLKEEGIKESYLIEMFEPVISPRCYGIIAVRSKHGFLAKYSTTN